MLKEKLNNLKQILFGAVKAEKPLLFTACLLSALHALIFIIVTVTLLSLGLPLRYIWLPIVLSLALLAAEFFLLKNQLQAYMPQPVYAAADAGDIPAETEAAPENEIAQAAPAPADDESAADAETAQSADAAAVEAPTGKKDIKTVLALAAAALAVIFSVVLLAGVISVKAKVAEMTDGKYYSTYVVYALNDTVKSKSSTNFSDFFSLKYYTDETYADFRSTLNYIKTPVLGIDTFVEQKDREAVQDELAAEMGVEFTAGFYYSFPDLGKALLDGDVDYIILNEAMTEFITEAYPDFLDKVTVVSRTYVEKEVENASADPVTTDPFVMCLCGLDTFDAVPDEGGSDVNILLFVNPTGKEVVVVSTPRDMYVYTDGKGSSRDKLTNIGRYGGYDGIMKALNYLYDIQIDYYVKTTFTGFMNIIDKLEGIDVTPSEDFKITSAKSGTVLRLKANTTYHLDGGFALPYVRERKQLTRGDRSRAENGQQVFEAMFTRLTGEFCENGIFDYYEVILDNIKTNMDLDDARALLEMQITDRAQWTFSNYVMDGSDLYTTTVTSGSAEVYVMVPDGELLEEIKAAITEVMAK